MGQDLEAAHFLNRSTKGGVDAPVIRDIDVVVGGMARAIGVRRRDDVLPGFVGDVHRRDGGAGLDIGAHGGRTHAAGRARNDDSLAV